MAFLSDDEWRDLLRDVHARQVIPIVGPELVTVEDPTTGTRLPLIRALAPALADKLADELASKRADKLKVPLGADASRSINRAACEYLLAGGTRKQIYREIAELLDRLEAAPPQALCDLASITDFDLYLSGTIDHLLAAALARCRPGFRPDEHVLAYSHKRPIDVPERIGDALVYHLVGNRRTYPDFAVWEEDYLEFLSGLILHHAQLERLMRLLKERYLLLLGMPFDDWLVRFFLFAAKGGRFSDKKRDDVQACLADRTENLAAPLVFFFDRVVGVTRIVHGDPTEFTSELTRRWRTAYGADVDAFNVLAQMPDAMPRGAVFVSYSSEDLEAVTRLARGLRSAQVPVWLDKQRLQAGEDYEHSLEAAVRVHCSFFVSVISTATERCLEDSEGNLRFVHRERRWAAQRHMDGYVFYVPVAIDDTPQPKLEPEAFAKIHFDRLPGGEVTAAFTTRLRALVTEWRESRQPRA